MANDCGKPRVPTEDEECFAFVEWLELRRYRFTHVPMETFTRSWGVKARNRRLGVRCGMPDYCVVIPLPDGTSRLAFVEMKRVKSPPSSVKPEQRAWVAALSEVPGVTARVCRGALEAIAAVEDAAKAG